jgi:hypothetical protein
MHTPKYTKHQKTWSSPSPTYLFHEIVDIHGAGGRSAASNARFKELAELLVMKGDSGAGKGQQTSPAIAKQYQPIALSEESPPLWQCDKTHDKPPSVIPIALSALGIRRGFVVFARIKINEDHIALLRKDTLHMHAGTHLLHAHEARLVVI